MSRFATPSTVKSVKTQLKACLYMISSGVHAAQSASMEACPPATASWATLKQPRHAPCIVQNSAGEPSGFLKTS